MKSQKQFNLKMRSVFFIVLFINISFSVFSQDVISLKKGKRIEAFVTEITPTLIKYKLSDKPNGREYFVYKEDVSGILYKNGKVESFDEKKVEKFNENAKQKAIDENPNVEQIQRSRNTIDRRKDVETNNYIDVIYLKNGSIIRGMIIEQIPNVSYKIETADENLFVVRTEEVDKITKEVRKTNFVSNFEEKRTSMKDNSGLQSGYKFIIEQDIAVGVGDYGLNRYNLHIINGGQINPYFSIGGGTGINYYYDSDANSGEVVVPVFADFRFNFINRQISPFFSFDVGYSFLTNDDLRGLGLFFNPTAGITFKLGRKFAIHLGTGYEVQQIVDGDYSYSSRSYSDIWSGAFNFKVGISF